jgi:hypothetical protein
MAVLKIFPEKDATLYSSYPNMNTGLDEIIEATLTTSAYSIPNPQASRFVIQFNDTELSSSISLIPISKYNSGSWISSIPNLER